MRVDLNSDLGEGFGPWQMGDDAAILDVVTSANIACGGHAGDCDTMVATLEMAKARGVVVGAHPGYADPIGFGRRVIPMSLAGIERMVATQIGALMGASALVGVSVRYVKAHGALANLAADDRDVADSIARAIAAISKDLGLLAIAGTEQVAAGEAHGLRVYSEVFADRAYLDSGRLVPRSRSGAMIDDAEAATGRLLSFLQDGLMPTLSGGRIALRADSICVHGDSPQAVQMARVVRQRLQAAGVGFGAFMGASA